MVNKIPKILQLISNWAILINKAFHNNIMIFVTSKDPDFLDLYLNSQTPMIWNSFHKFILDARTVTMGIESVRPYRHLISHYIRRPKHHHKYPFWHNRLRKTFSWIFAIEKLGNSFPPGSVYTYRNTFKKRTDPRLRLAWSSIKSETTVMCYTHYMQDRTQYI